MKTEKTTLSSKQKEYHESKTGKHRITNEQAINSLISERGNFYDYSKVVFCGSKGYIEIGCPIHGWFEQRYDHHKNGSNCKSCSKVIKKEVMTMEYQEFVKRSEKIHKGLYHYYENLKIERRVKVKIFCKRCDKDFYQTTQSHLEGHGCRTCNRGEIIGFKRSQFIEIAETKGGKATLYIIKCYNETETFYKVGITTNSVEKRFSSGKMPYKYTVEYKVHEDASYVWDLEKRYLESNKENHYIPKIPFSGHLKECFSRLPTI